jgi:hypothetical protein
MLSETTNRRSPKLRHLYTFLKNPTRRTFFGPKESAYVRTKEDAWWPYRRKVRSGPAGRHYRNFIFGVFRY